MRDETARATSSLEQIARVVDRKWWAYWDQLDERLRMSFVHSIQHKEQIEKSKDIIVIFTERLKRPETIENAIHVACVAAGIHWKCSYPECACKQMPSAICAVITACIKTLKE